MFRLDERQTTVLIKCTNDCIAIVFSVRIFRLSILMVLVYVAYCEYHMHMYFPTLKLHSLFSGVN